MREFSIAVFGHGAVGKTSLIKRYLYNIFSDDYNETIEDIYRKTIHCKNNLFDLKIIDTAGNYQFPAMRSLAIQRSHAFIIVYDMQNRQSFVEAQRLYHIICKTRDAKTVPIMFAANKCDSLDYEIADYNNKGVFYAWPENAKHIKTSAKNDKNITSTFEDLIQLYDEIKETETIVVKNSKSIMRTIRSKSTRNTISYNDYSKDWGVKKRNTVSQINLDLNKFTMDSHSDAMEPRRRYMSVT